MLINLIRHDLHRTINAGSVILYLPYSKYRLYIGTTKVYVNIKRINKKTDSAVTIYWAISFKLWHMENRICQHEKVIYMEIIFHIPNIHTNTHATHFRKRKPFCFVYGTNNGVDVSNKALHQNSVCSAD